MQLKLNNRFHHGGRGDVQNLKSVAGFSTGLQPLWGIVDRRVVEKLFGLLMPVLEITAACEPGR